MLVTEHDHLREVVVLPTSKARCILLDGFGPQRVEFLSNALIIRK